VAVTSSYDKISRLIDTYRTKDPRLAEILSTIASDLNLTILTINPLQETVSVLGAFDAVPPDDLTTVVVSLLQLNIQITWGAVTGAQFYEIREGVDWDTAVFILKTASLSANIEPRLIGSYNLLIKGLSSASVYSTNAMAFQIIIPALGSMVLSASTIDNNVMLSWNAPTSSFQIHHYNLYKDTIKFAEHNGLFFSRPEVAAGTYLFEVEAVDIVGNMSAKASASATVNTPPDYMLQDERTIDLSTVTKSNAVLQNGRIIACVNLVETYQDHFTSRGWASPQDQIDDGYARWIQDNPLTGYILDEYDYGTVLSNTVASVSYVKEIYTGTNDVLVVVKMSWSEDGITWNDEQIGESQFIASLRYLRLKFEFNASNDDAMISFYNAVVRLSVKREVDSGSFYADENDSSGTLVLFNKSFKDVDSITATAAEARTPIYVSVNFLDVPNPVSFRVLAFDSAGRRVSHWIDWKARGIV
jgi:hypothetical protein